MCISISECVSIYAMYSLLSLHPIMLYAHCLGYQKIKMAISWEKTFCCVLFCPSSRGKNLNLSFFRIPNEKCRHNLCLRAIKRHVDEKREWRENSTAAKLEYKSPGLTHLCSLSCIFLSTLFLKFELSEFGPPLTWTPQRVHIC